MEEFTRTIEKEQTVYVITKEELEEIKRVERGKGRNDIIGYIAFCSANFNLQLNVSGCIELCEGIIDFVLKNKNYINNLYRYSFYDYIKKYR